MPWSTVAEKSERKIVVPMSKGMCGLCARSKETMNVRDVQNNEHFNNAIDHATGYKTKTMLCVPVLDTYGECIGVIQIINKKEAPAFDGDDEKLLQDFSVHVSVALGRLLHLKFESKAKKRASDLSDGDEDEGGIVVSLAAAIMSQCKEIRRTVLFSSTHQKRSFYFFIEVGIPFSYTTVPVNDSGFHCSHSLLRRVHDVVLAAAVVAAAAGCCCNCCCCWVC